jgi:hypothetical protein
MPFGSAAVTEEGSIDLGKQGKPTRRMRECNTYSCHTKEKIFDQLYYRISIEEIKDKVGDCRGHLSLQRTVT